MKPDLSTILAVLLGASLLGLGTYIGVWYERAHSNYWRDATMVCIDEWSECKKNNENKGVGI